VNGARIILWLCAAIAVAVFATMIYSIIAFHKSLDSPTTFVYSQVAEIVWALIPIAVLLCIAIPSIRTLLFVNDR
jgi:heme/copper-type cytochrome/quinol oxidase subunit 2